MNSILLSIKPQFVEKIFDGTKEYEFRKIVSKEPINKIIIYSTNPVMKVVGEATVEQLLNDSPEAIWEQTKRKAGIDENFFNSYFSGKKRAFAYKLSNVVKYSIPRNLSFYGINQAPQSFIYIKNNI